MTQNSDPHKGPGRRRRLLHRMENAPGWIFTILLAAAILWFTLAPQPVGDMDVPLFPGADKLVHAIMFGALAAVMIFDWSRVRAWRSISWWGALLFGLLSTLFGIGIEYLQRDMALGRGFEIPDMAADAIGSFLAAIGWMIMQKTRPAPKASSEILESHDNLENPEKPGNKHWIKTKWLRVTLKTFGWILLIILLIPVAIYIPPVQTALKNVACKVIKSSTGMDVTIDRFRLRFPLDVSLQGVSAVEASGDTLASVGELIADVKMRPLFNLDVQINELQLRQGYYRMVSADSSMIMKIRAGKLDVSPNSSADIAKSRILLDRAELSDGDISLYMDVWKKKPTPPDSVKPSTPFLIKARELKLHNITFAMSMLPTIDTLRLTSRDVDLDDAVIDLGANSITASNLALVNGSFRYVAPTPEYVRTHPAPIDTISPPSPPMKIRAANVALCDFGGVYTIKGSRPLPGFDANYVEVADVDILLKDFYNEASTVILPIASIKARERSGLQITQGSGTFRLDSIGINLSQLKVLTPYSRLNVTADIPFALMEMKPDAPVDVNADVSLGIPDVLSFMPSLRKFTSAFPSRQPLNAKVQAHGTLSSVDISSLDAAMPGIFSLRASGYARNPLDLRRLDAFVDLDGELRNPSPVEHLAGPLGFDLPPLKIKGKASASGQDYAADFTLTTPKGNVAAEGNVSLNSERYFADVDVHDVNVATFMPSLGIGSVTASLHASGAGFNPTKPGAYTDAKLDVAHIVYNGHNLTDIYLDASLHDGEFWVNGSSPNPDLDFYIDLSGSVAPDLYAVNGVVNLRNADLQALGLSKDICNGMADFRIDATASPDRWLYNATLDIEKLDWDLPGQYIHLPNGAHAYIDAQESSVVADLVSLQTNLHFESPTGLQHVVDAFMQSADEAMRQVGKRELVMDEIQRRLPPFALNLTASGKGLIQQFLTSSGMSVDTVYASFTNDSLLRGNAGALSLNTGSMQLDTLRLDLSQRGSLLDYKAHLGNRPGNLDELSKVDLNGYLGSNRISAYLRQHNVQGEMGYRLGLTAALMDSTVSVHFTPLKATIAYLPWTLNADNHIDLNLHDLSLVANLLAKSKESSILVETQPSDSFDGNQLHLNLTNIHIQDFLQMSVFAPPLTATINSDLKVAYNGEAFTGGGNLDISDFVYDKTYVGDFSLKLDAGVDLKGDSMVKLSMDVDDSPDALAVQAVLTNDPNAGLAPKSIDLLLDRFPLKVANAFLGPQTATLSGYLDGKMDMAGDFSKPMLNGDIRFNNAKAYIPFMGTTLSMDTVPLTVKNNIIDFDRFDVWAVNDNPITLDGDVNATDFSDISFDLTLRGKNVRLVGNDKRAKSDLYGNLFVDLDASARGPMRHFDVRANLSILSSTDVSYNIPASTAMEVQESSTGGNVVKFVNLSDTTQTAAADSIPRTMNMRVFAQLSIVPGAHATVNLASNGTDKVQLSPSGQLSFFMNYMGDVRLNGQLTLGEGLARYTVPVLGQKTFVFDPKSNVLWNGDIMNPVLNIHATDPVKATVTQAGGNTQLVNFLISLSATGSLSQPKIAFDLSTDDDMTVQNELQSMSADQRQQQAMNMLLTGQYTAGGLKSNGPIVGTGTVYNFLAGQLNSWAAKNIRGVDLSFGVDQYDKTTDGRSSTTTSYSYQLSKSLFNNKFKIAIGGNYSTDASADENLTQNLISDISFEYMIKQTATRTMLVKLFRHSDFESILEGEVSETGVGFVMKRRLSSLKGLFRFRAKKHKNDEQPADSASLQQEDSAAVASQKKGSMQ